MSKFTIEDKVLIKKLLQEAEEALEVLKTYVNSGIRNLSEAFAVRYAIIQIVESLAIVSSKLAEAYGIVIEGYVEAMRFLSKINIVSLEISEKLIKLARLRNLLVHKYWVVDDKRILKEARENGIKTIEVVIENIRKLLKE